MLSTWMDELVAYQRHMTFGSMKIDFGTPHDLDIPVAAIQLEVLGRPAPQGSKRAFVNKYSGKAMMVEQAGESLKSWRASVSDAAREAWNDNPVFLGPVGLGTMYFFRRPKVHYGSKNRVPYLKPQFDTRHITTGGIGDQDKLDRAIGDALTQSQIIGDDRQISRRLPGGKFWVDQTEREGAIVMLAFYPEPGAGNE